MASIFMLIKAVRSRSWPRVIGTITFKGLDENTDGDGTAYKPIVRVAYQVDGASYNTELLYVGSYWGDKKKAEHMIESYRVGAAIPVFYNPKNPKDGLLQPGVAFGSIHFMIFFTVVNTAVALFVYSFR